MVGQHAERYLPLFLESATTTTKAVWQSIDKDGSGTLDVEELGAACCQMGKQLSEEQLAAIFQQMDTASSGEVSYEKFGETPVAIYRPVVVSVRNHGCSLASLQTTCEHANIQFTGDER